MTDVTDVADVPEVSRVSDVRVRRRVEPRFGVAIAGAGVAIAVGGAISLAGEQTGSGDDPNGVPGVLISLLLIVTGVALVRLVRVGPLPLAGSVAAAVGVPALLVFATIDDGELPGFDLAATLLVSALAWAVLHVVCDGRLLFLAAALVALPLFVMEVTEHISDIPEAISYGFSSGFSSSEDFESFRFEYEDDDGDGLDDATLLPRDEFDEIYEGFDDSAFEDDVEDRRPPELPDPTVLGAIAMLFAVLYVGVGQVLASRGSMGISTPPTVVGALLAAAGMALLAGDLREIWTGLALIGLGSAIAWFGVEAGRRFTTWWGALLLGLGVLVLIDRALGDTSDGSGASLAAVFIGAAVVLIGHVVAATLVEAPEEGAEVLPPPVLVTEPPTFEVPVEDDEA
jgi:hypothetical protein